LEDKLRKALGSAHHSGDVVKQMRDEIKQYQTRVWIDNALKVKI